MRSDERAKFWNDFEDVWKKVEELFELRGASDAIQETRELIRRLRAEQLQANQSERSSTDSERSDGKE